LSGPTEVFRAGPLPKRRRRRLIVLLACCVSTAALGNHLNFLESAPIAHFSDEDIALLHKTAVEVLDDPDPKARREWSNPKTGSSGTLQANGGFVSTEGDPCKRLRIENKIKKLESVATYTVCKHKERGWSLHAGAKPAPNSKGNTSK
jgi:hypothetical protein